jgi:tape measure domain-containing protein
MKLQFASLAGAAGIGALATSFLKTGIASEKMVRGLEAALGSVEEGAKAQKFLREESERLGLVFENQISDFQKIAAAARGTALEGQAVRDIYVSIVEASTALQLSSDETSGALNAIGQMISKGNVQAEELRGQLGERLPGAFQIAAKAMGVTTSGLGKMLEQGQVVATDFLPKFAKALSSRYEDGVAGASQTAQAELNRLSNAYFDMKKEFMETGALDAFTKAVKLAIPTVKKLGEQINLVVGYWAEKFTPLTAADVTLEKIKETEKVIKRLEGELNNSSGWLNFWKGAGYSKEAEEKLKKYKKQLAILQVALKMPVSAPGLPPTPTPDTITATPTKPIDKEQNNYNKMMEGVRQKYYDQILDEIKSAEEKKLEIKESFNEQYAKLGKSSFDLERDQLSRQIELWEKAGVKQTQIAQLTSNKFQQIKKAETMYALGQASQMAGGVANSFMQMSQAGGKHSKKAFRMYQAFAIAQAVMNTATLAMAGAGSVAALPFVGPALAAAWIPTAYAMGAAQIAMIAAAKPPSYDQGGISNAKGIYQTGNIAEAHIPIPSGGKIPVQVNQQKPVQVILNNPTFQDIETQQQVMAQIAEFVAERVAPGAVVENYNNDGIVRQMTKNGY